VKKLLASRVALGAELPLEVGDVALALGAPEQAAVE
jgi:hypothetical protein